MRRGFRLSAHCPSVSGHCADSSYSLKVALTQVDKLNGRGDQAIAIAQINLSAQYCRHLLEKFLADVQKYEKSLGPGVSVGKFKGTGRKVQYAFLKKDEADKLRNTLSVHIRMITMSLAAQSHQMHEIDSQQRAKNQEELREKIEKSCKELQDVRDKVETQAVAVQEHKSVLQSLVSLVIGEIVVPFRALSQTVTNI